MNGTLQDRLVKALRRAKIADLDAANRFLAEKFLPKLTPVGECRRRSRKTRIDRWPLALTWRGSSRSKKLAWWPRTGRCGGGTA